MKGAELLSRLRSAHKALTLEDGQWTHIRSKVDTDKKSFLHLRSLLDSSAELREHLSNKMTILRSRRDRQRKSWRVRREERREGLERAERVTEKWVKDKQQQALKAKMEKSVQASASGVLEEVKRKKTDLKRFLDLADTLSELRTLRREASRKKGDGPPIEADERFRLNRESLVGLLTQQLGVYEREEHALRVLMEEEVKEKLHSHQTKAAQLHIHQPIISSLDPMEACKQFYLQAETNRETREAIRSDWDIFISPKGSSLPRPSQLLSATPPSNNAWQQYCCRTGEDL